MIVVTIENLAREMGVDPEDLWAYTDRRKAPPKKLRDAIVAAYFPLVPPESFLPSEDDDSTIRAMRTEIEAPRRGRPLGQGDVKSKLPDALRKAGVTLAEVAAKVKRTPPSIRAMSYPKSEPSHRPAPRAVVELLRDTYGIPLSVWPEIVG